jgi:hypothetical protein
VTSGDGAITYAVTSAGTTNCSVDAIKAVITYSGAGECEVTATAAATAKYAEGSRAVVFTIPATAALPKQDMTAVQPTSGPTAYTYEAALGNPDVARTLAPGLRLLSRADAARARTSVMKPPPGATAGDGTDHTGQSRDVVRPGRGGQAPGQVVNVRVGVRGTSVVLGAARADAAGRLTVPALAVARVGVLTLDLASSPSGMHRYVKVLVIK